MANSFAEQLRAMLYDQQQELLDIEQEIAEHNSALAELHREKADVTRAIMKTEQLMEQYGIEEDE